MTSLPTSITSPANSWPIVIGSGGASPTQDQSPCHVCQSVRQMPSTATLTIASRGPGCGSGTSLTTRGWAISTSRAAFNSSSSRSHTDGGRTNRVRPRQFVQCIRSGGRWRALFGVSAGYRRTSTAGVGRGTGGWPATSGRGLRSILQLFPALSTTAPVVERSWAITVGGQGLSPKIPWRRRRQTTTPGPRRPSRATRARQSRAASTNARASSAGRVNITSWLPPISTSLNAPSRDDICGCHVPGGSARSSATAMKLRGSSPR